MSNEHLINSCTFVIQPNSNFLVDIIKHGNGKGEQDFWKEPTEVWNGITSNFAIHPTLQFKNPPHDGKNNT